MFEVTYNETATVTAEICTQLDPADYLQYDTKQEVYDIIVEEIQDELDYGDFIWDDCLNSSITIPDEFWEEWEKLKQEND